MTVSSMSRVVRIAASYQRRIFARGARQDVNAAACRAATYPQLGPWLLEQIHLMLSMKVIKTRRGS